MHINFCCSRFANDSHSHISVPSFNVDLCWYSSRRKLQFRFAFHFFLRLPNIICCINQETAFVFETARRSLHVLGLLDIDQGIVSTFSSSLSLVDSEGRWNVLAATGDKILAQFSTPTIAPMLLLGHFSASSPLEVSWTALSRIKTISGAFLLLSSTPPLFCCSSFQCAFLHRSIVAEITSCMLSLKNGTEGILLEPTLDCCPLVVVPHGG